MNKNDLRCAADNFLRDMRTLRADSSEYIGALRVLAVKYIDDCAEIKRQKNTDVLTANRLSTDCCRHISNINTAQSASLPSRLASFMSEVAELRAHAPAVLRGGELLDFYAELEGLMRDCAAVSRVISTLHDTVIPVYVSRLFAALESGGLYSAAREISVGFIATLDAQPAVFAGERRGIESIK